MQYKVKIIELTEKAYTVNVEAADREDAEKAALSHRCLWENAYTIRHHPDAKAEPLCGPPDVEAGNIVLDALIARHGWKNSNRCSDFSLRRIEKRTPHGEALLSYERADEYGGHLLYLRWHPDGSGQVWDSALYPQERWSEDLCAAIDACVGRIDGEYNSIRDDM